MTDPPPVCEPPAHHEPPEPELLSVLVVTVSTRAAAGEYEDRSGPAVAEALRQWGVTDAVIQVVSDDETAHRDCPA